MVTDEVDGFEQLQVDMHVEGHLPPPLQLLLYITQHMVNAGER